MGSGSIADGGVAPAVEPESAINYGPSGPRAGFFPRVAAQLIDLGILMVVPYFVMMSALGVARAMAYAVGWTLSAAYHTYFEGGARGQTLGKRLLGIRVVDPETEGPIGYRRAFVRWIAELLSATPLCLGYFWMLDDREQRCWHDILVRDIVVPVVDYPIGVQIAA